MPQTVPSAGFTPPCDYSTFAENFDLSLLPGGDLPLSPSTTSLYTQSPPPEKPKIYTTYYINSPNSVDENVDLNPDFQKLLLPETKKAFNSQNCGVYLDIPSNYPNSPNNSIGSLSPYSTIYYPNSPDTSFYSPGSAYSKSPNEEYINRYIKKENSFPNSPIPNYPTYNIKEEIYLTKALAPTSPCNYSNNPSPQQIENNDVFGLLGSNLEKQIKQESTVDFGNLLQGFEETDSLRHLLENNYKSPALPLKKPEDHQLLREVLRDTSFQKKYNIKPIDLPLLPTDIKMEEPDDNAQGELMNSCNDLAREKIEPVLNLAIEQMRKDVKNTCTTLGISQGEFV